jgi:hypothetical protein
MNVNRILFPVLIGVVGVPIMAQAGDFPVGNAATFAQNIIEPDAMFRGGGALPKPPGMAEGTIDGTAAEAPAVSRGAELSVVADSGHAADRPADTMAPAAAASSPESLPIESMAPIRRPAAYRWQSLVPGVLK